MTGAKGSNRITLKTKYYKAEMIGKIKNRVFPPAVPLLGLKQGDNLSPLLFDLFFENVENIFDSEWDPVTILLLNHLLFADDMALESLSRSGLQRCLQGGPEKAFHPQMQVARGICSLKIQFRYF